ncbi:histidine kinase [uncultured Turicimonas sp.]|uniref:histidine kinase n=1 Tax=uncultured Turicimonas sp. TaxID=1918607 RepID=UPI0028057FC5|nr:histidine kinase [uncultured Turicimonas sp.]
MLIFSLGITFTLFSIFLLTGQSSNKGSAINISGSLRMQSYVVALTVAEYATREQEQRTKAITGAVNEFERRLNSPGLVKAIPNKPNDSLRILYHEIYSDFYGMLKPMAEQVIENPSTEAKFLNYVPSFVSKVDKFVFDIEQSLAVQMTWLRIGLIATCILVPLLGAVFLIYFQKVFFLPLQALADVASAVRKGNFTVRSNYKKENEIGVLAGSFNYMIEDLSRLYESLEEEVKRKTKDLDQRNKTVNLLFTLRSIFSSSPTLQGDTLSNALAELMHYIHGNRIALFLVSDDLDSYRLSTVYPQLDTKPKEKFLQNLKAQFSSANQNKLTEESGNYLRIQVKDASRLVGYLVIHFEETQEEPRDYRLFESVSEIFATALINARKREEGYRLALYEERSTIARELHDSIAQSLAFSKIQLTRLSLGLKDELPKGQLQEIVNELRTGVSTAYTQLREVLTAFRLKPTSADIRQSIHKLLEEFHERSGIEYNLKNDLLDFEINANKQVHLIHILKEALTNVEKHSRASKVNVSLSIDSDNFINVSIADNGKGLQPAEREKKGHFGLSIMEERAKALDAEINFLPNTPTGLIVNFRFRTAN